MKNILLISILLLNLSISSAQVKRETAKINPSLWDIYPWKGQGGIKLEVGTNKQFFCSISYMKSDLPKQNSKNRLHGHDYVLGNQNIFGGLGFTSAFNDYFMTSKFGYEYNIVLLSGRISSMNYYSFKNKNIDLRILLEPGITICGFIGAHYGYSIPINKNENTKIGHHQFSVSLNYFDMWRSIYSNEKIF